MRGVLKSVLKPALGAFFGLGLMFIVGGDTADAQCCAPPPPPCCAPPPCCTPPAPPPSCCTPPTPPTPPENPCCTPPGHSINVPGVNVNVNASVVVNAAVNAQVNAAAQAGAVGGAGGNVVVYGGGGGFGGGMAPNPTVVMGGLNVQGARQMRRVAYEARRERTTRVVIQAFCLDDRLVPHPASQVFPEQDVDGGYEGELYRCLAGTSLQYSWSEYQGEVSFDGGQTVTCSKDMALWHGRGGRLECRPQEAERDCNERSLLRRYGAGIKILTMTVIETYTAYREEEVESASSSSSGMSFSGGVGGYAY